MSNRTDGTAAAAVGAHSKDAMEALHGGNYRTRTRPGRCCMDPAGGAAGRAE